MSTSSALDRVLSPDRYREAAWFSFGVFWALDLATTVVFFAVSYLHEENLITVISYRLFGLAGVPLAAVCYAAVAVGIIRALPDRFDTPFLVCVTTLYATFVLHNATLIAQTTHLA